MPLTDTCFTCSMLLQLLLKPGCWRLHRAVQRCGRLIDRGVMPDEKLPIPLMVFV
jgi:hypothetical protein